MCNIQELEERLVMMREEMPNMTGRDRNTQWRMINELAARLLPFGENYDKRNP